MKTHVPKIKAKYFDLQKIAGAHNPADILTKHIDSPTLTRHLGKVHNVLAEGRAESAPVLTH